jgi:hypothetical protein
MVEVVVVVEERVIVFDTKGGNDNVVGAAYRDAQLAEGAVISQ